MLYSSSWAKMFKNAGVSEDGKTQIGVPMTPKEIQAEREEPFIFTSNELLGWEYRLEPDINPKTFDRIHDGKTVVLGIYDLQGDRLWMKLSTTSQRPTKLNYEPK